MKPAVMAAGLLLSGCAGHSPLPANDRATLDLADFFVGRSRGEGELRVLLQSPQQIRVDSVGKRNRNGTFVIDQRIRKGAKVSDRRWTMRRVGSNVFTGTLSDATGPVEVRSNGSRATIRYRDKDGVSIEQHLALQGDGKTILNRLQARKFGVRVAELNETIRKLD